MPEKFSGILLPSLHSLHGCHFFMGVFRILFPAACVSGRSVLDCGVSGWKKGWGWEDVNGADAVDQRRRRVRDWDLGIGMTMILLLS